MACTDKFTITKGVDNTFVFTIKQTGTTLPMKIVNAMDTFDAKLITLETGEIVLELGAVATANGSNLTIKDEASGKIELLLTKADIAELIVDKGPKVDRYYARPSYKMVIECNTVNNGEFLATIPYVYVE